MELTSEAVRELMNKCFWSDQTPPSPELRLEVQGIVHTFAFDVSKVKENTDVIAELLAELPKDFQKDGGGGWSFLNACVDKQGNQWTGLHLEQECLFVLGIAAGKAEWVFPRDIWPALPGGMPYIVVN